MLRLLAFAPAMGMISPSPFSVKSLALLEMSGLPYERVNGDPRRAPKRKLPVLDDAGRLVADSHLIQAYLARVHGFDPDAHLTDENRAVSTAFRALVEDQLYWVLVYARWIDNPKVARDAFFATLPAPLRNAVFGIVRRQVRAALHGQGLGRHERAQVYRIGTEGVAALAEHLGDKPYFLGGRPSGIDTALFGFLENVITPRLETPLKEAVMSYPKLVSYRDRFEAAQVPALRDKAAQNASGRASRAM